MRWGLIFGLSLLGMAMAIATVFIIPANVEMFCWLPLFIIFAYVVAKHAPGKYFFHGFMISIFNCVWITAAHVLLSDQYAEHHPQEVTKYLEMNGQFGMNLTLKQAMLMTGPIAGVVFGLIIGLFCFVASKVIKK